MKIKFLYLAVCISAFLFVTSCSKSDDPKDEPEQEQTDDTTDDGGFNGTQDDIANFVSQDILDVLIDMGFAINTGNTPPIINGVYEISPRLLENTNVTDDYSIGTQFVSTTLYFENQSATALTFDYKEIEQGVSESLGDLSFISGSGNVFSAFVKTTANVNDSMATLIIAVSGKLTDAGFTNTQQALFMLDNHGNPQDEFIENGQGRIFKDEDGTAEIVPPDNPAPKSYSILPSGVLYK